MKNAFALGFILMCMLVLGGSRYLSTAASKSDYVPDEATAVRVAEAVLIPLHGRQQVEAQRPYTVSTPEKGYWLVSGSAPQGQLGNFCRLDQKNRLHSQCLLYEIVLDHQ